MGNRIIKESICVSEQIDEMDWFEEVFFYRLLVNCDDYGVMDARPKILKARLFPLRDVSLETIGDALETLVRIGLIRVYEVDGRPYLQAIKWAEHQRVRDSKHKYPVPDCGELPQVAASCGEQTQDAAKSGSRAQPRAGAESESISESISESESLSESNAREALMDDAEAREIQNDHDRVLDAAVDAGFMVSNSVRAALIRLYAKHGLVKVLDGIASCVKHGAPNLAYLEACLKGGPRKQKTDPNGPHNFEERDYSGVNDEMMENLARDVEAFQASGGGT